jgi:acetyltransferase-like isoleucine patch superfamily enzyme
VAADRRAPAASEFRRYGRASFVVPPARVVGASAIEIGDEVIVLEKSELLVDVERSRGLVIGDRTKLGPGTEIVSTVGITIGRAVSTSDYVAITDSWTLLEPPTGSVPPDGAPVVIEDGAYLGCGSIVGPGVRIGEGAFVGEGAVVLADVDAHTVVYGNPARVVRRLDRRRAAWEGRRFP